MAVTTDSTVKTYPYLIDGKWLTEGPLLEVKSPYDAQVVGVTNYASSQQLDQSIASAVKAFEITRRMPAYERQRILRAVADAVAARADEFARLIALEAGKPIKSAKIEVDRAVLTFSIAAEESTRINGEWLPLDLQPSTKGRNGIVRRFPVGPIAAITPFNFPLNLVAHKVAPAIAAGCTTVLKPAPKTPLSALALAEVIHQAGLPAGALNVINLSNDDAARLVTDERIKLLSFTGSAAVGWDLKSKAGKKKVVLELGGNAAVIVHSDADIAKAAHRCSIGGFSYAGQSCISVQRIFVHRDVENQFTEELLQRVRKLKMGDPLDESSDLGPMINEDAAKRAASWVEEARAAGANVLTGGTRKGAALEPVILTGTTATMRVSCEEIFAPVVLIEPYDDFDAVLRRVNDSPYGLQAGLFTHDANLIFKAYDELEVGGLILNDASAFRIDNMPYGGVKESGFGREGLRYSIEDMTEPRLLVLNLH